MGSLAFVVAGVAFTRTNGFTWYTGLVPFGLFTRLSWYLRSCGIVIHQRRAAAE
jgi:hypothetical protein